MDVFLLFAWECAAPKQPTGKSCAHTGNSESRPKRASPLSYKRKPSIAANPALAALVLLFANLFTIAFPRQCFFHALLFARLQVKRMTLYFFDDVFRLNLAFEPSQRVLKGFALLNSNLCQRKYTSPSRQQASLRIRYAIESHTEILRDRRRIQAHSER